MDIHESANREFFGHRLGRSFDRGDYFGRKRKGRDNAGAIAAVDPGFFDVLHDRADNRDFAVGNTVYIHFDRIIQKVIDQDRTLRTCLNGSSNVAPEVFFIVDNLHCPTT